MNLLTIALNKQIAALQKEIKALKAGKDAQPAPAPARVAPAQSLPPPPPPPAPARPALTPAMARAIMIEVFHESPLLLRRLSARALVEDCTARIAASRLTMPGLRPLDSGEPLHGHALIHRGIRQDALNAIVKRKGKL